MDRLAIVAALLLIASCEPRKKMAVYTPPPETSAPPPQAGAPPPTPTNAPEVVVGPAFTPHGLVFPPGWPVPPIPSGFPLPFPPPPSTATAAPTTTAESPPPSWPTATATATAPPPPPPSPPSGGDAGWPAGSASLEDQVLTLVNARRAAGATCGAKAFAAAPPLQAHPSLRAAARLHSKDMATNGYFDHKSLDGREPVDRMKAAGWAGGGYTGENIAAGNATAQGTVQQWMNSPGHCENIMDPGYKFLGVGYFHAPSSKYKHYWTQNFGG